VYPDLIVEEKAYAFETTSNYLILLCEEEERHAGYGGD
jgi:hypothetical protein